MEKLVINQIEFFMLIAPKEPQEWFEPVMESEKPEKITKTPAHLVGKDFNDPEVSQFIDDYEKRKEELTYWNTEYEKQRLLQWPLAWAKEMVRRISSDCQEFSEYFSNHLNDPNLPEERVINKPITVTNELDVIIQFVEAQKELSSNSVLNHSMFVAILKILKQLQ